MASKKPRGPAKVPIYQLKITLEGSDPHIWRRVFVPAFISLRRLHKIIQVVMGWQTCHLHMFEVNGNQYGEPNPEYGDFGQEMLDDKKALLGEVDPPTLKEFLYIYDFGDGWRHKIEIENILKPQDPSPFPICTAGARACPPEDVGALGGYYDFLEAIRDPKHPEHEEKLEWIGGFFDPLSLDLNSIHRRLKSFRPTPARIL